MGSVARSYMRKVFLIYEEMRKYLTIYEEAVSHIWLYNRSRLNLLIYSYIFYLLVKGKISKNNFNLSMAGILTDYKSYIYHSWGDQLFAAGDDIATGLRRRISHILQLVHHRLHVRLLRVSHLHSKGFLLVGACWRIFCCQPIREKYSSHHTVAIEEQIRVFPVGLACKKKNAMCAVWELEKAHKQFLSMFRAFSYSAKWTKSRPYLG